MYKRSKYNILYKYNDTRCLVLNTLSGAVLNMEYSTYENMLSKNSYGMEKELLKNGIIISKSLDELKFVNNFRKNVKNKATDVESFVVLPTTHCNARCSYCYEKNFLRNDMDNKTADMVANMIINNSLEHDISITWFGGEPLLRTDIIDQISNKILNNIDGTKKYSASIISNGSLITDKIVDKFINNWNIIRIQITLDGTQNEYNKRKNYIDSYDYYDILTNIRKLVNNKIKVVLRLNFDKKNSEDIIELIKELGNENLAKEYLSVYVRPLHNYTEKEDDFYISENEMEYYYDKFYHELFNQGFIYNIEYFNIKLKKYFCRAYTDKHLVIDSLGNTFKCEHLDNFEGKINFEDKNNKIVKLRNECIDCVFLPTCQGGCLAACEDSDILRCITAKYTINSIMKIIQKLYERNKFNEKN